MQATVVQVTGVQGCRGERVQRPGGERVWYQGDDGFQGKVVWQCTKEEEFTVAMHSMYHGRAASGCMVR